jgi:hypothetical protein
MNGRKQYGGSQEIEWWVIVQMCGDDAYETFAVPTLERCLLGRSISMTRR